ncbi:domain of Kin17 curved DNA-binding protein-domain-containing protein [Coniochaeta sp. 2T2.1]|nr:domain of Kin17 curved DNA-binding protein-domain-containing protein [Coniochaeta sp. 2T2.1]
MPKAEVGSTKYLANKMKMKGLQRLRWYCQLCEKQCRDENGFKMHSQSESHTRKALEAGANFKGVQEDYSKAFLRDFVQLLKTGHREKAVHVNKFYQEYIANKEAVHMNATKWNSLTEFAKFLGREGVCRVEEKDDGIYVAWIDDSPEALRRREHLRRKEMMDKGDEEREMMMLEEQIKRARRDVGGGGEAGEEAEEKEKARHELLRREGETIKLSFGGKKKEEVPPPEQEENGTKDDVPAPQQGEEKEAASAKVEEAPKQDKDAKAGEPAPPAAAKPVSLKFGAKPQPKNVFKNALGGGSKKIMVEQPKKMSEAERIMKEEMERKRGRGTFGGSGFPPSKKQKF